MVALSGLGTQWVNVSENFGVKIVPMADSSWHRMLGTHGEKR